MTGIALVTGGSSGIGAATCLLLIERGWDVAVNFNRQQEAAERLIRSIKTRGGRAIAVQGDFAKESDVERIFETIDDQLGPLTGLVNNAGIVGSRARFKDVDFGTVREVMAVNVMGTMRCSSEAVKRISTAQGGK